MNKRLQQWLLPRYKKYKQNRNTTDPVQIEQSLKALLNKTHYYFLTTHGEEFCSTRYVQPIVEWQQHNFTVWIGTHAHSRKVAEIRHNPLVTLAVGQEKDGANLIIYGQATVENDATQRRKYWKSVWSLFFPDGPLSDDAVLLRVMPIKIELMDFKRNIIPEPFGLKPLMLEQRDQRWAAGI